MKPNPYLIDDDSPEWTEEDTRLSVGVHDIFTPEQLAGLLATQARMRAETAQREAKTLQNVKLEKAIVEKFKATGEGWQQRINDVLRKELAL